jgi:hypothetical protein
MDYLSTLHLVVSTHYYDGGVKAFVGRTFYYILVARSKKKGKGAHLSIP